MPKNAVKPSTTPPYDPTVPYPVSIKKPRRETVLDALNKDIAKWESLKNREEGVVDNRFADSALCDLFHEQLCYACPITYWSKTDNCNNTPYNDWLDHQIIKRGNANPPLHAHIKCSQCNGIIEKMIEFLTEIKTKYESGKSLGQGLDRIETFKPIEKKKQKKETTALKERRSREEIIKEARQKREAKKEKLKKDS